MLSSAIKRRKYRNENETNKLKPVRAIWKFGDRHQFLMTCFRPINHFRSGLSSLILFISNENFIAAYLLKLVYL